MQNVFGALMEAAAAQQTRASNNPENRDTVIIQVPRESRSSVVYSILLFGAPANGVMHWRLFAQIGEGASIELNSQKLDYRMNTRLFITYRPYAFSDKSSYKFTENYTLRTTVTVDQVISLLLERKRDQYVLQAPGSGCRYWCETAMADFESMGWFRSGTAEAAHQWLDSVAGIVGQQMMPVPMARGTFF